MAIVYGYFRTEEEARLAARRCEELGITSAVLENTDTMAYVDDAQTPHMLRREEYGVLQTTLISAAIFFLIGGLIWFVLPGMWDKVFLAAPMMMALYGAGIGIVVGMWRMDRRGAVDEMVPAEISTHVPAERVVVVNTADYARTQSVEELLESQGAVEVIHRAA